MVNFSAILFKEKKCYNVKGIAWGSDRKELDNFRQMQIVNTVGLRASAIIIEPLTHLQRILTLRVH